MFSSNILCGTQALWLFNMERSGQLLTSLWKLEFCTVKQMKLLLSFFEVTFCSMASDQPLGRLLFLKVGREVRPLCIAAQ